MTDILVKELDKMSKMIGEVDGFELGEYLVSLV